MEVQLPIQLANLSMADSLILMILALVVFGPRRLPQIGRQIGKLMYEFRKASNDFKFQMEEELRLSEEAERRKTEEAARQQAALAAPAPSIEAQADIGAVEATPVEAAGETAIEPQSGTEVGLESEPEVVHLPRVAAPIVIQPPSTGERVAAERPNTERPNGARSAEQASQEPGVAESAETELHADSNPTEPIGRHG